MLLVAAALLALPARAEPCGARLPAELGFALDGADASWGIDPAGFSASLAAADAILPCLVAPLNPPMAARVHRVHGLAAFAARDNGSAMAAFVAARRLDPAYTFPDSMIPAGNPVRSLYDAPLPEASSRPIVPAQQGVVYLDGVPTRARLNNVPTVFQLVRDNRAETTMWVPADGPLPAYPKRGQGLRGPFLVAAGVAAAGGAALYAVALAEHDAYLNDNYGSVGALDAQGGKVNALAGSGVGLGVLAVGLGTTAFVAGRW